MSYVYTDADISALFKVNYDKLSEATFSTMFPTLSRLRKRDDFTGTSRQFPVPQSFGGSVGSGSLPAANKSHWANVTLNRHKLYARLEIDRETIYAARDDAGSFIRATKEFVRKTVESYTRNMSRLLFAGTNGELGIIDGGGVAGVNPYTLTISAASWKEANWEEGDYVNIETGNTDRFEIDSVTPSTRQVVVTRRTGAQVPVATDHVFMQGSEGNDPTGIRFACDAVGGTLFGVTVGRRWQATQIAAGGAGITADILNQAVLTLQSSVGKAPDLIVMSYVQYRRYLDQCEDQKVYTIGPRDKQFEGLVSFGGLQYLSSSGPIPIVPERFVEDDRVYLLNTDNIVIHRAPGFGWFDDDGTVLLRMADSDAYEARYGGYLEVFTNPAFQAAISGLAT